MPLSLQHCRYMMGVVMLLMLMPPGMWVSSLPNILETYEAVWVLPYATALPAAGAIFSALVFGALSDQRVNAEKLLGVLGVSGAFFAAGFIGRRLLKRSTVGRLLDGSGLRRFGAAALFYRWGGEEGCQIGPLPLSARVPPLKRARPGRARHRRRPEARRGLH